MTLLAIEILTVTYRGLKAVSGEALQEHRIHGRPTAPGLNGAGKASLLNAVVVSCSGPDRHDRGKFVARPSHSRRLVCAPSSRPKC